MLIRTVKFATRLPPGGSLIRDLFFEHGECDGLSARRAMLLAWPPLDVESRSSWQ